MSMKQLHNCPKCGNLFIKGIQEICHNCLQKIDADFQTVKDFLKKSENRKTTIQELSAQTGVSVSQITTFIHQKRLTLSGLPNMGYPCELCGTMIRNDRFCIPCRSRLTKETRKALGDQQAKIEQSKLQPKDIGYRQQKSEE